MSNNLLPYGVFTGNGSPSSPMHSFIDNKSSGLFRISNKVGISHNGSTVAYFAQDTMEILTKLKISYGAKENSVLTCDSKGYTQWSDFPVKSGEFLLNSLCKNLDISLPNNEATIYFDKPMNKIPSISLTKECDLPNVNPEFYVKNKTNESFTLYFDTNLSTNVVNSEVGSYSIIKLYNGCFGVCYYDYNEDRVLYKYSLDEEGSVFSDSIIVDDVSATDLVDMVMVDGKPAIIYIVDNEDTDEWRYIRSVDENGKVWGSPLKLMTSTTSINFLPISLFLLVSEDGNPMVLTNNENGRAQIIISSDKEGSSWESPINVSNLINHQILSAKIIEGFPGIVAKSNTIDTLYVVRANKKDGTSWPIGATQLYNSEGKSFFVNQASTGCDLGIINGKVSIVASEKTTNNICLAYKEDLDSPWTNFETIATSNTPAPCPSIFENSNRNYLLYNDYIGSISHKNLIEFTNPGYKVTADFMASLELATENLTIKNNNNSVMLLNSKDNLTFMHFYGNDYKINWLAT